MTAYSDGRIFLSDRVFYWPKGTDPLCAEVFAIQGDAHTWFFDVGNGARALQNIRGLPGKKCAVISHFHPDHMGNVHGAEWTQLYLGDFACKKAGMGQAVTGKCVLQDGILLTVCPLPSSHAKGSLMLEAAGFLFLGDGIYSTVKNGKRCYNATLLLEGIRALGGMQAEYCVLSHAEPLVQKRQDVILGLQRIYDQRRQNEPYIFL